MNFLLKLQNLSAGTRKIILWSVVIVIGLSLLTFWFKNLQQRLKAFQPEEFIEGLNIPAFEKEIEKLPEFKMPEMGEIDQELKKLEEIIKQEVNEKK